MSENPLARHGKVSYLEIPATDLEQSAAFYEAIFGWAIERRENGDRVFWDGAGDLLGRWIRSRPVSNHTGILPYVYVSDIGAAMSEIDARGGSVAEAPRLEGDTLVGRFRDPAGNIVGIWQFAS